MRTKLILSVLFIVLGAIYVAAWNRLGGMEYLVSAYFCLGASLIYIVLYRLKKLENMLEESL